MGQNEQTTAPTVQSIPSSAASTASTTRARGLTQAQAATTDENEVWPDEDWSEWYDGSWEEDWPDDDDDWEQFDYYDEFGNDPGEAELRGVRVPHAGLGQPEQCLPEGFRAGLRDR